MDNHKQNNLTVYMAFYITGQTYDYITTYVEHTKTNLEKFGYSVLHPMTAKESLRTELVMKAEGYKEPTATNHAIFERDKWMVQQCDIVYCNLTTIPKDQTPRVSIGAMMEIAWASLLGKHTVLAVNHEIYNHAFVKEAADIIFNNHLDALRYLRDLGKRT